MDNSSHLVRNCIFDLDIQDQSQAEAVVDMVSRFCSKHLPGILDQAFKGMENGAENVLRIDRLTIDLGELDHDDLEGSLIQGLKTQIIQSFQEITRQQAPVLIPGSERRLEFLVFFCALADFPGGQLKVATQKIPKQFYWN